MSLPHGELFLSTSPLRGTTVAEIRRTRHAVAISIHVPLAGDDRTSSAVIPVRSTFLSTSPLRGTTNGLNRYIEYLQISIHVPLAGDDL